MVKGFEVVVNGEDEREWANGTRAEGDGEGMVIVMSMFDGKGDE